jgi:hypothetical protein
MTSQISKRPTRSNSIGCEEDLKKLIKNKSLYLKKIKDYINELRLKKSELNNSSSCVNELLKSPLFLNIHKNLIHFIDDDETDEYSMNQQQHEKLKQKQFNLLNLNQHQDVKNNNNNEEENDYYYYNENISDDENDVKLVTKSVPNSPKLFLRTSGQVDKEISFVYDINLYSEKNNLDLLAFDQQKLKLEAKKQEQIDNDIDEASFKSSLNRTLSSSSSRSSSLSSLHKFVNKQLEPLEINEQQLKNEVSITSTSSSSVGSSTGVPVNDSMSVSITPVQQQQNNNNVINDVKATNSSDSLRDVDDKIDVVNDIYEDVDDDSINSLSESQMYLKDNYEKAKKERQLEEEKAVEEKKRLQVSIFGFNVLHIREVLILDILSIIPSLKA